MRIHDTFRVNRSVEETWAVLLDIERIAPCLPGAELHEVDGDEFRGVVKVKVGPITAQYQGTATLAAVDEDARRVRIDAQGRDTRGQGNAKAAIEVTMAEVDGGTEVAIDTDLSITGKVAQFGRGVLGDVSAKLLATFADNLERDVLDAAPAGPSPVPTASATPPVEPDVARVPEPGGPVAPGTSGPRRVESVPSQPVDLLDVAGAPVGRRLVPVGIGLVVLLVLWRLLRRRPA